MIPFPFTEVVVVFGRPVRVGRDADKDEMEEKRRELEEIMRDITGRADRYWDNG